MLKCHTLGAYMQVTAVDGPVALGPAASYEGAGTAGGNLIWTMTGKRDRRSSAVAYQVVEERMTLKRGNLRLAAVLAGRDPRRSIPPQSVPRRRGTRGLRTALAIPFFIAAIVGFGLAMDVTGGSAAPHREYLRAELVCPPNYAGMVGGAVLGGIHQVPGQLSWNLTCNYRLITNDDRIDVAVSWYPKDTVPSKSDQPFYCGTGNLGIDTVRSKSKAAYATYKGANRRFEVVESWNSQAKALAETLLAAAEERAVDCGSSVPAGATATVPAPAKTAAPTLTPTRPPATATVAPRPSATKAAELPRCVVQGAVRDAAGTPVTGIRLSLLYGKLESSAATDGQGVYRFPEIGGGGEVESSFDPRKDRVKVVLSAEEYAHKPSRFVLNYRQKLAQVESDSFLLGIGENCERNFDFAALRPGGSQTTTLGGGSRAYEFINPTESPARNIWPELLRMYRNFQNAWALADKLSYDDLDYGLPLQIFAWCDDPEKLCKPMAGRADPNYYAFFRGSTAIIPNEVPRPWIGISTGKSATGAKDAPRGREYHEFGHFFLADIMHNAWPKDIFGVAHGGMYVNDSSSDAWVEGFASFYAMLVARDIAGETFPERQTVGKQGVVLDLEQNFKSWEEDGFLEEYALTGLLWDFVDGNSDYRRPSKARNLETRNVFDFELMPGQLVFTGEVVNRDSTTSERTQITMKYIDNPGETGYVSGPTSPEDIPPGGVARFYLPLPKGTLVRDWEFSTEEGALTDDDPLQVDPAEVMASIEGFKSDKALGEGRLFDVQDLYLALKRDFAGRARTAEGTDAVDAIFVSHGFFADLNGNERYDSAITPESSCLSPNAKTAMAARKEKFAEEIGMSSHCQKGAHPEIVPRYSPAELPMESVATVDTGGVAARALVHVAFPRESGRRSYGYFVDPEGAGTVDLAVPPGDSGATITLLMLADGYLPAMATELKAVDFWAQAARNPGKSFLSFKVTMKPGEMTPRSRFAFSLFVPYRAFGGLVAAGCLGILALVLFGRRKSS